MEQKQKSYWTYYYFILLLLLLPSSQTTFLSCLPLVSSRLSSTSFPIHSFLGRSSHQHTDCESPSDENSETVKDKVRIGFGECGGHCLCDAMARILCRQHCHQHNHCRTEKPCFASHKEHPLCVAVESVAVGKGPVETSRQQPGRAEDKASHTNRRQDRRVSHMLHRQPDQKLILLCQRVDGIEPNGDLRCDGVLVERIELRDGLGDTIVRDYINELVVGLVIEETV